MMPASDTTSHRTSLPDTARMVVTVCTYNEREQIGQLISEIRQALPAADVLVVDDNSPDGTAEVVRAVADTDPQVSLMLRATKAGLGAATRAAFQHAIARRYDVVLNLDADFSHPPENLPDLVRGLQNADVCIGSRYVHGGRIVGWPWRRHFMSRGVNWLSRWWLWLKTHDNSGAFRAYRTPLLARLDWAQFRSMGYAFQEELLFRCVRLGAQVVETPIVFVDRTVGQSKINWREIAHSLWDLVMLGFERR